MFQNCSGSSLQKVEFQVKRHCSALIVLQVLSDGSESGETRPAANVQTHCLSEGDSLDYETAGKVHKDSKTKCVSAVTLGGGTEFTKDYVISTM